MRPKSMVLILIALACGLVASIGISQVVDKKNTEQEATQTAPVYVAAVDVAIHERLTTNTVRREEWPIDRIPPGAITSLENIDGRKPSHPLYKGEVILGAKLVDPNSRAMTSERIPKGYRVVSVKVNMDSAVSGLLSPGDRVDVLCFFKRSGRGRTATSSSTKTVLTDVTVFAINSQISRASGDETDAAINAKTVSLTVTPSQAQRLLLAAELGTVKLSLRHNEDDSAETPDETKAEDLTPQGGNENLFNNILSGINTPVEEQPYDANQPVTMEVLSPTSSQKYEWRDRESLPDMVQSRQDPTIPTSTSSLPLSPSNEAEIGGGENAAGDDAGGDAEGFDFESLVDEGGATGAGSSAD